MAAKIKKALDNEVQLIAGGGGIFDVKIAGKLEYSKAMTGTFPEEDHFVAYLAEKYKS